VQGNGTAEGIYSAIKHVFAELDTTNVMFGEFNSISQLLMSE
jgi:hypothetical protein